MTSFPEAGNEPAVDIVTPKATRQERDDKFEVFYRQYYANLVAFLMILGARFPDAAEVAQDTMTELYRSWLSVQYPKAWTRRVASRKYIAKIAAVEREDLTDDVATNLPSVVDVPAESYWEERHAVLRVLRELTPRERQVLAWTMDGFSTDEIAKELAIKSDAVRQALSRARRHAAKALSESGVDNVRQP